MQSSTSKLSRGYSGSPPPQRFPNPDLMSRGSIINTRLITNITPLSKKQQTTLPSADQLKFLRKENKRLLALLSSSGKIDMSQSQSAFSREKDGITQELRSQSNNAGSQSSKEISPKGNHHSRYDQHNIKNPAQNIKELNQRIYELEVENEHLKRRKNSSVVQTPKQRPVRMDDPLPFIPQNYGQQLMSSNMQRIKQNLRLEFDQTLAQVTKGFTFRLEQLERRLETVSDRLNQKISLPASGQKYGSTMGSFPHDLSPGLGSSYGQNTNNYQFHIPGVSDSNGIRTKLTQLQDRLSESNRIQGTLRRRVEQLECLIQSKNSEISRLYQQLNRPRTPQSVTHSVLVDSQSRNKLMEENATLKHKLSTLSGQIVNLKNGKVNLQRQYQSIKRWLQNQRKIRSSHYASPPPIQPSSEYGSLAQLQNTNRQLENDLRSLHDTLAEVRRSLQGHQSTVEALRKNLDTLNLENSELSKQLQVANRHKQDSASDVSRLKLRINELERSAGQNQHLTTQFNITKRQLELSEAAERQVKAKVFSLETENGSFKMEVSKLQTENDNLKRMMNSNERQSRQLLQNSDNLKEQVKTLSQQKAMLENQITLLKNQVPLLKSQIRALQEHLYSANSKEYKLQSDKRRSQDECASLKQQLSQVQHAFSLSKSQIKKLADENRVFQSRASQLQYQVSKQKADNQKQTILHQINILTERLRDSELRASNLRLLQQQRNNELQSALAELGQVKRLLTEMNFESVEAIVKELRQKEKTHSQQKFQIENRFSFENQRLKQEALQWCNKYSEQRKKADRMASFVSHLEADNKGLSEKVDRLEMIIKKYSSQDFASTQSTITQGHLYSHQNLERRSYDYSENSLRQMEQLKEPVQEAVSRLDKIAQKVRKKQLRFKVNWGTEEKEVNPKPISQIAIQVMAIDDIDLVQLSNNRTI